TVALIGTPGDYTSVAITGDLPATYKAKGEFVNPDGKSTWTINATHNVTSSADTLALSSKMTTYRDSQAIAMDTEIEVKPGSKVVISDAGLSEAQFDVVATGGTAQFAGSFTAANSLFDKSGTVEAPMDLALSGSFRNAADAASPYVEFASG